LQELDQPVIVSKETTMQVNRRNFLRGTAATALALSPAVKLLSELGPTSKLIEGPYWSYLLPTGGDDTAMINAAIRAAAPEGTVVLGPGIFKIDGIIKLFEGDSLSGCCDGDSFSNNTLVKTGKTDDPVILATGGKISNLNITCPDGPAVEVVPVKVSYPYGEVIEMQEIWIDRPKTK
jgi:hypothetical protein